MPKALLVYPKHPPTYWGGNYALEMVGIKAAFPPLGLRSPSLRCFRPSTTCASWI